MFIEAPPMLFSAFRTHLHTRHAMTPVPQLSAYSVDQSNVLHMSRSPIRSTEHREPQSLNSASDQNTEAATNLSHPSVAFALANCPV